MLPFSRQYTVTAMCYMPLVPWVAKVKLAQVGGAWALRAARWPASCCLGALEEALALAMQQPRAPACPCKRPADPPPARPLSPFLPAFFPPCPGTVPQWYLNKYFFKPTGLGHLPPTGPLDEQDWSGEAPRGC